ncbi:MAG: nuclear transport factor 2 family protein, partial [Planctomycetia bacterium]|nr:nuclear transport factor 2 family protein [Planctomycetia bacterium]
MGMGCVVRRCLVGCFVGCLAWAASLPVCGQVAGVGKPRVAAPSPRATDEQAIRAATAAYQQALDRWDGKAMADLWTADGDIIDGDGRV